MKSLCPFVVALLVIPSVGAPSLLAQQATTDPASAPRATRGSTLTVTVILQDGDSPPSAGGATVNSLGIPFTNGDGEVGFVGGLDNGDSFVWFDDAIAFLGSSVGSPALIGGESVMGIGDSGEFVFSPSIDGADGLWTDLGQLAVEGTAAPGFPAPAATTFHTRPTMDDTGQAYWIAGVSDTGGGGTDRRVLYTSTNRTPATITPLLASGDMIDGFTIESGSAGIDVDYQFSGDGSHHIQILVMDTHPNPDFDQSFLYVDGNLVGREGTELVMGETWDNLDFVAINNSGQYLVTGDTNADSNDEVIAFGTSPGAPSSIGVREGDTIDGVTLAVSAVVRAVAVNDQGCAAHAWSADFGAAEHVFIGQVGALGATSDLVLSTGQQVDVDGNGTPDATVTDLNDFGPTFHLNESNVLYLPVDLDFGSGARQAILAVPYVGGNCTLPVELQSFSVE